LRRRWCADEDEDTVEHCVGRRICKNRIPAGGRFVLAAEHLQAGFMTVQEVKAAVIKFLRTAAAFAAASGAGMLFMLALVYGKNGRTKEERNAEKEMEHTDTAVRGYAYSAEDERRRAGIKERFRKRMRAVCAAHMERRGSGAACTGSGGGSGEGN